MADLVAVAPISKNFGSVVVGERSDPQRFELRNITGNKTVKTTEITLLNYTDSEKIYIDVVSEPQSEGTINGSLSLNIVDNGE